MGWSSGVDIAIDMIDVIQKNVPDIDARKKIYKKLIETLEDKDCDNICEALEMDPVFDKVVYKMYPEWKDNES